MSIQLEWQINAEQTSQQQKESPEDRQKRRRTRRNLLLSMGVVGGLVCLVAAVILLRWQQVQGRAESDLRAAAEAEFAALRIGDQDAFMSLRRSDSEAWLSTQAAVYADYQTLKQTGRLSPQNAIQDVLIDEERGRVIIQETLDGQTYQQVWFYWNYPRIDEFDTQAGWRRVPSDVTFWGEEATLTNPHSTVTYQELDAATAQVLAEKVELWWVMGCELLQCATPAPNLELVIDPQAPDRLAWEPDTGWRLRVVSPLLNGRVPVENPLPASLEQEIALALAERLLDYTSQGHLNFTFEVDFITQDTQWVKYQLRDWLVANFKAESAPFITSLQTVFGAEVVGRMATTLADGKPLNTLVPILSPEATNLNVLGDAQLNQVAWGDFFHWRLELERLRLVNNDFDNFFALYEGLNGNAAATARSVDPAYRVTPPEEVQKVLLAYREDGALIAIVDMLDANGLASQTTFVWQGETFVRTN